jgi:hypothetical protein
MKKALLFILCVGTLGSSASPRNLAAPKQNAPRPPVRAVTAAQINGLYRYQRNDFRILALGHRKLKVQFNGEWMTNGGYPNIGEAMGEATIEGNVATFIPGDTTKCKITLTFLKNRMAVNQEGDDAECGFGHNVMARGTYRRVKAGRPRFIPVPR